jgi:hypothetical protein
MLSARELHLTNPGKKKPTDALFSFITGKQYTIADGEKLAYVAFSQDTRRKLYGPMQVMLREGYTVIPV